MKNRHYFLSIGLPLALLAFSCEKITDQEPEPVPGEATQTFQLFAVPNDPDDESENQASASKTTNSGMSTLWAAGDQLGIMHGQGSSYTMDGAFTLEDAATGKFEGTLSSALVKNQSYNWLAIYPYMATMTTKIDDAAVAIGGNMTQSAIDSRAHLAGTYAPLWGKATSVAWNSTPTFNMTHLSTFLEIIVTNGTSSTLTVNTVKVILPSGKYIRGTYNVNLTGSSPALDRVSGSESATLTLGSGTKTIAAGENAKFYLAAAPFDLSSGQQIHVEINGVRSTATMPSAKSFAGGKMKKLNVTYKATPNQIYVIDKAGLVLTLNRIGTTETYATNDITACRTIAPVFWIAEKITNGAIDDSGWVIGGNDYNNVSKINDHSTDATGIYKPDVYYEYSDSKPDGIFVDMSNPSSPKMQFRLILDYNAFGDRTDDKVRWVCPMPNNCRVEFMNFPATPTAMLNTDWFTSINNTTLTATYTGKQHNYEAHYVKTPKYLTFWQLGGSQVFLIGRNASCPPTYNASYTLADDNFYAQDNGCWKRLYMMETTTSNVFKTTVYLNTGFGFQFYTAAAWAQQQKGVTSTTPATLRIDDGIYGAAGTSFTAGLYTLTYNSSTKQATLVKK